MRIEAEIPLLLRLIVVLGVDHQVPGPDQARIALLLLAAEREQDDGDEDDRADRAHGAIFRFFDPRCRSGGGSFVVPT